MFVQRWKNQIGQIIQVNLCMLFWMELRKFHFETRYMVTMTTTCLLVYPVTMETLRSKQVYRISEGIYMILLVELSHVFSEIFQL
jgi:hypothetical protein